MLRSAKSLENFTLRARDGDIGQVKDFYFDDQHWHIRYFVVETGRWLESRQVLISPEAASGQLWADRAIPVNLTQDQVRHSPSVETQQPLSREHESLLRHHYGWPPYWGVVLPDPPVARFPTGAGSEANEAATERLREAATAESPVDPHLRSIGEVDGYHVEATDGRIGHVEDFLIDDSNWRVGYVVINTRNWLPGKRVIIAPGWIRKVDWSASTVCADLTRDSIKNSPAYDPSHPMSSDYLGQLHQHFGRPPQPDWDPEHKTAESRRNFSS